VWVCGGREGGWKMALDYIGHINRGITIQRNWKDHVERKII
jgi:hypothetical protein